MYDNIRWDSIVTTFSIYLAPDEEQILQECHKNMHLVKGQEGDVLPKSEKMDAPGIEPGTVHNH